MIVFVERGIGFLADIRRMNVGLTRARCSLFVLGHKRSLMGSQYWGDLVKDAMDRNLLINVTFKKRTNHSYPYRDTNVGLIGSTPIFPTSTRFWKHASKPL